MKMRIFILAALLAIGKADDPEVFGIVSGQGAWEYAFTRTDPHDNEYQWRHYYDEKTGKPIDARVPVGWTWERFTYGAKNFDCPAEWNGEQLNICKDKRDDGEPRCCIRGAEKAARFCQSSEGDWCLTMNFMEEKPDRLVFNSEEYEPSCKDDGCPHWQDSDKFFSFMVLGDESKTLDDGKGMEFYEAIEEPIYVLMGIGEDTEPAELRDLKRGMHTPTGCDPALGECSSSGTKDKDNYTKFWNASTPPTKCGDGSLKDCNGECFNSCKVYGLDGSEQPGYGGCFKLVGDFVCDWGQRIMSNGEKGPKLNCPLWNVDAGDCDCDETRTMTCSGYCLADADCASTVWGKDTCEDWLADDVCDYGQRISDAGITMHFECDRWNYDNAACDQFDPDATMCPGMDPADTDGGDWDEEGCPNPEAQGERNLGSEEKANMLKYQDHSNTPGPTVAPHYKASGGGSAVIVQDLDVLRNQVADLETQVRNMPKYTFPEGEARTSCSFKTGDRVWVNFFHSGYWYPATVIGKSDRGWKVSYDGGDVQNDVHKDEVFSICGVESGAGVWKLNDDRTDWTWGTVSEADTWKRQTGGTWEYKVDFVSGESWVPRDYDWFRPDFPYEQGDRVWCEKGGNLKWSKGTITEVTEQGSGFRYEVTFDSGDTEAGVPSNYLYFIHSQRVLSTNVESEEVCSAITQCNV